MIGLSYAAPSSPVQRMRDQDFAVAKFVGSKRAGAAPGAAPAAAAPAKVNEKKEKADTGADKDKK